MSSTREGIPPTRGGRLTDYYRMCVEVANTERHRLCMRLFLVIVLAHWAEHIVQAVQIYVMDWPVPEARGLLGMPFPWLVTSEWMHYGYALIMLIGLLLLLPGFEIGRAHV